MKHTFHFALLLAAILAPAAVCQPRSFSVSVSGSGLPMILIPGLESPAAVWDGVAAHYRSNYQVHALTLAGFAGQPAVPELRLFTVRDDIIRYIRERHLDHPVIVGHSLGGFLALWIAAAAPDLACLIVSVDGVPFLPALFDPAAGVDRSRADAGQMRRMYASLDSAQMETMARMALTRMITAPNDVEMAAKWAASSDASFVGQAVYDLMTTDLRPEMGKLRAPLLLIAAGKAFGDTPGRLSEVQSAYEKQVEAAPDHHVVVAANALHFVMLDDRAFLLNAMDGFLSAKEDRHAR